MRPWERDAARVPGLLPAVWAGAARSRVCHGRTTHGDPRARPPPSPMKDKGG